MNSTTDVDRLVSENQGLVVHLAKQHQRRVLLWCATRISLADLIAEGKIGLAKAAKRFNPAKGKFSTYAAFWINKHLFKARFKRLAAVSLSKPIGDGITLLDAVADNKARPASDLVSEQDARKVFRRVMVDAGLDDRERAIMFQRYGLDDGQPKTQKQIAKKLVLTKQRIGQLEKVARGKIEAYTRKKNRV
jgi:RNA polymerase sporulation-specific sigma factor